MDLVLTLINDFDLEGDVMKNVCITLSSDDAYFH